MHDGIQGRSSKSGLLFVCRLNIRCNLFKRDIPTSARLGLSGCSSSVEPLLFCVIFVVGG